jgi:hypothetical protein
MTVRTLGHVRVFGAYRQPLAKQVMTYNKGGQVPTIQPKSSIVAMFVSYFKHLDDKSIGYFYPRQCIRTVALFQVLMRKLDAIQSAYFPQP